MCQSYHDILTVHVIIIYTTHLKMLVFCCDHCSQQATLHTAEDLNTTCIKAASKYESGVRTQGVVVSGVNLVSQYPSSQSSIYSARRFSQIWLQTRYKSRNFLWLHFHYTQEFFFFFLGVTLVCSNESTKLEKKIM